jgi:hypothetical protein
VDFAKLETATQERLIELLTIELNLGFTLLAAAQHERSLRDARKVLATVRHFEGRIINAKALSRIRDRADELEQLLFRNNAPQNRGELPGKSVSY